MRNSWKIMLVLLVTLLFIMSCVPKEGAEDGALAGQAVKEVAFTEEMEKNAVCNNQGKFYYVNTKYKNALDKPLTKQAEGCCDYSGVIVTSIFQASSCFSPSQNKCYNGGEIHSDPAYICKDSENWQKYFDDKDAPIGPDDYGYWKKCTKDSAGGIEKNYICNGKQWVICDKNNKYDVVNNYYCNGNDWVAWADKIEPGKYVTFSDIMTYVKTETTTKDQDLDCGWNPFCYASEGIQEGASYVFEGHGLETTTESVIDNWVQETFALDSPIRIGQCSKKDQCVNAKKECKDYDTHYDGVNICGNDHNWLKCNSNAEGIISTGAKFICTAGKWTKGTEGKKIGDYTFKTDKWINTKECSNLKTGQKCIFSDVVIKKDNSNNNYGTSESAITKGRFGPGTSKQCIDIEHKAFDYGTVAGGKVCGSQNRWLKCASNAQGVVSDDGLYVCDGNAWKEVSNTKKGCSACTAKEMCLGSHMSYGKGTWKEDKLLGYSWQVKAEEKYYYTNRVGCSTDKKGCVDKSGADFNNGDVTSYKNLCDNNNWKVCDQNSVKLISPSGFHYCAYQSQTNNYIWNECKTPGDLTGDAMTVCTYEGWIRGIPGTIHLADDFAEFLFDGIHWNECKVGGPNDGGTFAGYKCENGQWNWFIGQLTKEQIASIKGITTGKNLPVLPKPKIVGTGSSGESKEDSGTVRK